MYFSNPTSTFGYYRGTPYYPGSGSGMGQGVNGMGLFPQGQGGGDTGWTPTILYMFLLIIVEMVIFGFLAKRI